MPRKFPNFFCVFFTEPRRHVSLWYLSPPLPPRRLSSAAVILAHDKCPVFNDNWVETYLSEDFLELQVCLQQYRVHCSSLQHTQSAGTGFSSLLPNC